jgi:hypothetical protein
MYETRLRLMKTRHSMKPNVKRMLRLLHSAKKTKSILAYKMRNGGDIGEREALHCIDERWRK